MGFESGLRAALKDAIVARDAAIDRVEASKAAIERIEDQIFEAHRRLREARTAAAEEGHERVERIVAGGSAVLERNGSRREADIEGEIVALKSARDLVRGELADAERTLEFKQHKVTDRVGNVLASAAGKLIAEAESLRRELEGQQAILRFLRSSLGDDQRRRVDAMLPPSVGWIDAPPAVKPWKAAAEALAHDADAPIPQ